jgi:hypothetical protein
MADCRANRMVAPLPLVILSERMLKLRCIWRIFKRSDGSGSANREAIDRTVDALMSVKREFGGSGAS